MGAVTFSLDERLVECLKEALPLSVFVETGTFKGDTIAAMSAFFDRLITVEFSESLWTDAVKRFKSRGNIEVYLGKSPEVLANLQPTLSNTSKLFWLDAHWCVAENTVGDKSQCPLLEEIQAIHSLNDTSVILIDDARLFLATPPEPHAIAQWPSLDQIITSLRALSEQHELMVINDVIAFYPKNIHGSIVRYARKYGVDWLRASQSFEENTGLRIALEEKEVVIQQLSGALVESQAALVESQAALVESQAALAKSESALIEKESVILVLTKAVTAYRLALTVNPRYVIKKIAGRVRQLVAPRLGNLNQYGPIPLRKIPTYNTSVMQADLSAITIVTPSFCQGHFIERTLLSVLNQKYPKLEYHVQDGGSSDATIEILGRYEAQLSGWVSKKDNGQSQAINRGFANTSGEIMGWLNSDDLLLPGALLTVADYFSHHPEVDVVYGDRLLIDENDMEIGRWIMPGHDSDVLSWVDYVPQETMFWRRRIWDKVGGQIDESFRFAMDWDLLVRFRKAGAKFAHIPRFLGAFRIHAHQKTSAAINEVGYQEMNRIRERLLGRVPTQIEIRKAVLPFMLKHVAVDIFYRIKTRLRGK